MREADAHIDWTSRIERARALAAPCLLCEHRCEVDRLAGERGRCGLADTTPIYGRMMHYGEEAALVPSYVILMSGCSLHCTFCSEDRHLRPPFAGRHQDPEALADALTRELPTLRDAPRNINFVGAEPSISLPWILRLAARLREQWPDHPPLLLNTNGYITPEALALCEGVFDIFVVDLKFGNDACGWRVGKVKNYVDIVTSRMLQIAAMEARPSLMVRHLLMPDHDRCCTQPVLRWLETTLPEVPVNVMPGFVAFGGTRAERAWRSLTRDEVRAARERLSRSALHQPLWDGAPLRPHAPHEPPAAD